MRTGCELDARVDIAAPCASMRQPIESGYTQAHKLALGIGGFVFEQATSSWTTSFTVSSLDTASRRRAVHPHLEGGLGGWNAHLLPYRRQQRAADCQRVDRFTESSARAGIADCRTRLLAPPPHPHLPPPPLAPHPSSTPHGGPHPSSSAQGPFTAGSFTSLPPPLPPSFPVEVIFPIFPNLGKI